MITEPLHNHDERYEVSCPKCGPSRQPCYPGGCCRRCGATLEGHFDCGLCGERRNCDEGGAGEDTLSQACDHCVVAVWGHFARTAACMALIAASARVSREDGGR